MNIYANGFQVAFRGDVNEFVVHFLQTSPAFKGKEPVTASTVETVGAFVIPTELARQLSDNITQLLNKPPVSVPAG